MTRGLWTIVVFEVFSDDDEGDDHELDDDDDDDDDDVEVTVRGFDTTMYRSAKTQRKKKMKKKKKKKEEEEEEEEADEEFAADDVDNDDEEDDDFHPTYWEIAGEIEDQDFVIEYPPLSVTARERRGRDRNVGVVSSYVLVFQGNTKLRTSCRTMFVLTSIAFFSA